MYWCMTCQEFTEGEIITGERFHSEVDDRQYEPYVYVRCDFCGSTSLLKADVCACGELKLESEYACRECRKLFREHKLAFLQNEMTALGLPSNVINDLDESEEVACC